LFITYGLDDESPTIADGSLCEPIGLDRNLAAMAAVMSHKQSNMGTLALASVGLGGACVGAALGVPLLWPGADRRDDSRLIGTWFIALSVVVAVISGRVLGIVTDGAAAEHAINLAGLAAYSLLYVYLGRITGPEPSVRWPILPWLPAAAYVVVLAARASFDDATRVPFAWMLPLILAYTSACVVLVARPTRAPRPALNALVPARPLVTGLVLLNVAQIVRMSFGHLSPVRTMVPLVLTLEFIGFVALLAWRARQPLAVTAAAPSAAPRYERSGLDDAAARDLAARVEATLVDSRLFTDPGLTLTRLADTCQSTPHQVSEALNRMAGTTFHEMVARHRVAEVKRQLEDPASDAYSIEGIGQSAGFGSRSALHAAFKKAEGVTPSEYRARHR
jgi:AraC-like DNA-binding protein